MSSNPNNPFSLARNYPQLQNANADASIKDAIRGAYQLLYDLRDAIHYPTPTDITWRTLLLKDCTIGNDIADHVVVHPGGNILLVAGVLRKAISSALTVRLNVVGATTQVVVTFTIEANQPVNSPARFITFTQAVLNDMDVLSWDVLVSDWSGDVDGVASFTIWWK